MRVDVLHVSRLLGVPVDDANTPAYDEHSCEAVGTLKLARAYGLSEPAIEQMVLVLGRHSRDAMGEPVEWVTSWYRGDRITFVADLSAPRQ